jgi:hypothetical protein
MSPILEGCSMPPVRSTSLATTILITSIVLSACLSKPHSQMEASLDESFPDSVNAFGDGFPDAGAPCRRLGESSATSAYLDHTRTLAGCLSRSDAEALGGQIVGHIDGVWLISIPNERPTP